MGEGILTISGQAPGGAPLIRRTNVSNRVDGVANAEACHRAAVLMMTRPGRFRLVTVEDSPTTFAGAGCRLEVR
jgi:hypothetical protein